MGALIAVINIGRIIKQCTSKFLVCIGTIPWYRWKKTIGEALNLLLANREELIENLKLEDSSSDGDQDTIKLMILKEGRKDLSKIKIQNFSKPDFTKLWEWGDEKEFMGGKANGKNDS